MAGAILALSGTTKGEIALEAWRELEKRTGTELADLAGADGEDVDSVFAAIEALRIPAEYLANLFTAVTRGRSGGCCGCSPRSAPSCAPGSSASTCPTASRRRAGAAEHDLEDLYRLLAIAKYDDRYVIPKAHAEDAGKLLAQHELLCSQPGGPGDFHQTTGDAPGRDSDGRLQLDLSQRTKP
jgi:nitrate reductase beta subunit